MNDAPSVALEALNTDTYLLLFTYRELGIILGHLVIVSLTLTIEALSKN